MLCVTGQEKHSAALAQRLAVTTKQGLLNEVRLDALTRIDDDLFALLSQHAPHCLVCCRPTRQGGMYRGDEAERIAALERAARCGVAYIDAEVDLEESALRRLRNASSGKLVVSWHDFSDRPTDLQQRAREVLAKGDIGKIAVTVKDAIELAELLRIAQAAQKPLLAIGMGPSGLLSRCRYPAFGAPWTYVAYDESQATAPGQITLEQAQVLGLPQSATQPFLCLLGGEQAIHSPGMRVYNQLFRRRSLPWSYLTVISDNTDGALALVRELGALGVSVTMPHKQQACAASEPDELGRTLGAINTIRFANGRALSTNTDVVGIKSPLAAAQRNVSPINSALILGIGGAGSAAIRACKELHWDVTIAVRPHRLAEARTKFGSQATVVSWDERDRIVADVLINATALGGDESPWPAAAPLNKKIVFDLTIKERPSALLAQATREGAVTLTAQKMWAAQGAQQMNWITGEEFTVSMLEEILS